MRLPGWLVHRRGIQKALRLAAAALLLAPLPGCGKKGPPLAPLVTLPARIESLVAKRVGPLVSLQISVPDRNQDGSAPADLARLEVYGYTGDPGSTANFMKYGTLVATLPVRPPPDPEPQPAGQAGGPPPGAAAAGAKPRLAPEPGFDQGSVVTVTEALTPKVMTRVVVDAPKRSQAAPPPLPVVPPLWGPATDEAAGRVYIVVGVNRGGRRGAPSNRASVPLYPAPEPPAGLALTYTEDRVVLSWTAPSSARKMLQAPAAPGLLPSTPRVEVLPASAYNVYEIDPATPRDAGAAGQAGPIVRPLPVPLNEKPIDVLTFEDNRLTFGVERCYSVSTVDTFTFGQTAESAPSAVACVTPLDTFPPRAPAALDAIASEGAISLIWDANTESDLAGYLVLRGVAPAAALERLTPAPIRETTYRDTTAKSGVRYVYAVVAVDNATPPNTSALSNRVEEIAR